MLINIILFLLLNSPAPDTVLRISYTIQEQSSLTLSGSSNVNKFECTTYNNFTNGNIYIQSDKKGRSVNFTNALLHIDVKSFDCQNPLLNRDLYHTLNAKKSPYIDVELHQALPISESKLLKAYSGKFKADVTITLNGISKADHIIVLWHKVGPDLYRFTGTKELLISDFGIKKPVTALGLIRVDDDIKIDFDLFIKSVPR